MPKPEHCITRADIMDMTQYAAERFERRKAMTVLKKNRRVHIGPDATAYFESFDTVWHQIHEMLHIEQGGEAQIEDELRAYSTLVPQGRELVCTLMFEIDDPDRRANFLAGLGGVEETVSLRVGQETIMAEPEQDIDRTNAAGKASSIQFLHFPLNDVQAALFKSGDAEIVLAIAHEKYGHMAVLSGDTRKALVGDLD
ncbi:MAG: hypothetical protein COB59_10195 [Rhodospirillaceae bacterium]|nr:MAG: hypothetical protein COB59_10195 [Rhodospirillaceae bacterium]